MNMQYTKKLGILILLVLFFVGAKANLFAQTNKNNLSNENTHLKFNGLYRTDAQTLKDDPSYKSWQFLRFCENGNVVGMGTIFSIKRVAEWLECEGEDARKYSFGKYEVKDNQISFTLESESGKVDYKGIIENNLVILDFISHINNNSEKNKKYKFISVKSYEK